MPQAEPLRIVLDTNILLVSVSSRSLFHWIFQSLLEGRYELYVTNDILLEYEETLSQKWNPEVAGNISRVLLLLPNVHRTQIFYSWNLITNDPDDNKFVDCAVAANAHALVTHDKDFNVLKGIEFPKVNLITIDQFEKLLNPGNEKETDV